MRSFLLPVLALAAFVPAAVSAAPAQHSFERDGQSYTYSAERQQNGAVLLVGMSDDGLAFRLKVVKNHVEGRMGMTPVDFFVSDDTAARLAAEVTSDAPTAIASN